MNKTKKIKYLILGAGPSGLSFAAKLLELGETSFLILEKEAEAGGLCRSREVDGAPLDIGGGHFLDIKNKNTLDFFFRFLPEDEWNRYNRKSTIRTGKFEIDFPFESNIWQFPEETRKAYLSSISRAGCNTGQPIPEKFKDWIYWKLGDKIAQDYMIPYNKKIWSVALNRLGVYWLYKLPNVSYEDTLQSCQNRKPGGNIPAHALFAYPKKYGYGEVWKRIADRLPGKISFNCPVRSLNFENLTVNENYRAEVIVTTIPWTELSQSTGLPGSIRDEIKKLEYASIRVSYCGDNPGTTSHWVYIPDEDISHHRIVCRQNFCPGSKGYWEETNTKRVKPADQKNGWHHDNKFAYPINTIDKPKAIQTILEWGKKKSVIGLGRWGEWEHVNSDAAVENAVNLAKKLIDKRV
jgi:protoporphyrinogen oxidase